jgi:hypothetical protein
LSNIETQIDGKRETDMKKRTILAFAVAAVLLAPAAFYTSAAYQRTGVSTGIGEPDTMATDFLWTPNHVGAIGLGQPDTMATDFLWKPGHVGAIGLGQPDTMATEFLWVAKHASS